MINHQLMSTLKKEGRTQLSEVEAKGILRDIGIPVVRTELACSRKEAVSISREMGFPVAMKIVSPELTHKSDAGGVKLGLNDDAQVEDAYTEMMSTIRGSHPEARIEGVSIQQMAPPGTEVIIGMTRDPQFGPLLMFGLGGVLVELMKDVSFRIAPVGRKDAGAMISTLKSFALLNGYRGREPVDIPFLEEMIVRVSEFVEKNDELRELDINPIFSYRKGAMAVDARILLEPFQE